ncbi:MAG: 2-phosphosulfolactate phosphatase [bacterium]
MRVDVILSPRYLSEYDLSHNLVVVVDVFRATSTIITAIHNGARQVVPFMKTEEVEKKAAEYPADEVLKCGERKGYKFSGFDLGNSPLKYTRDEIYKKTLLFTSTNGSQVFKKVTPAGKILIGGFLNVNNVVDSIVKNKVDCIIACAGNYGKISIEDSVCAGMILARLQENGKSIEMSDEAITSMILYQYFKDDFQSIIRESSHGRYLASIGKKEDMIYCLKTNTFNCLPVYNGTSIVNSTKEK